MIYGKKAERLMKEIRPYMGERRTAQIDKALARGGWTVELVISLLTLLMVMALPLMLFVVAAHLLEKWGSWRP